MTCLVAKLLYLDMSSLTSPNSHLPSCILPHPTLTIFWMMVYILSCTIIFSIRLPQSTPDHPNLTQWPKILRWLMSLPRQLLCPVRPLPNPLTNLGPAPRSPPPRPQLSPHSHHLSTYHPAHLRHAPAKPQLGPWQPAACMGYLSPNVTLI